MAIADLPAVVNVGVTRPGACLRNENTLLVLDDVDLQENPKSLRPKVVPQPDSRDVTRATPSTNVH
jgi:hypothetical protein